ncbi:MAG TPA: hypothetical protein VFV38_21425 [Ktedonobacteraceae bacterium]|nr:hypothetical protein [Ktedonobacteraceae bacterium]
MNNVQKGPGFQEQENALKRKRNQTSGWFQKVKRKMAEIRERQVKGTLQETGERIESKVGEAEQQADRTI